MYESVYSLMIEFLPLLMLPVAISLLSFTFRIIKGLAHGCYTREMAKELMKKNDEMLKEEKKINIDKDLQKYFNYKE